jgi:hypothetical protein
MILSWQSVGSDTSTNQVDVSDKNEKHLASLNLLRLVTEKKKISVSDVSAIPGLVAVAAAYMSKEGSKKIRPASALVILDFSDHLVSFLSVAPWRDAERIELDADSNIWTLNSNADESKPAGNGFLLTEYSIKGTILRELLPRSLFPVHANEIMRSREMGFAAAGRNDGTVWFWLPGSTELITVGSSDGMSSIVKTGLPSSDKPIHPVNFTRDNSGALIGEFSESDSSRLVYYRWLPSDKSWVRFEPGVCTGGALEGSDEIEQIYLKSEKNRTVTSCAFSGH